MEEDIKYILFMYNIPYFCYTFKDIVKITEISESTLRRKLQNTNIINDDIYIIEILNNKNIDNINSYKFLVISNDMCEYSFHDTLKDISQKKNIDYSSICKYIKSEKYKTIGGNNPGRKKNTSSEEGYSIFIIPEIYYDIYS